MQVQPQSYKLVSLHSFLLDTCMGTQLIAARLLKCKVLKIWIWIFSQSENDKSIFSGEHWEQGLTKYKLGL